MTRLSETTRRLDRAITLALGRHHDPRLWLLNERQIEEYRDWQSERSRAIEEIEKEHGPGKYYADFLDGAVICPDMPEHLCEALELPPTPTIPASSNEQEAYSIWEAYIR